MTIADLDKDLASIQEVRDLIRRAKAAQAQLATYSQEQVDRICAAMAQAGEAHATELGRMAQEETGFGKAEDKALKNRFSSTGVWQAVKDLKTVGVIAEYPSACRWA